VDVTEAGRRDVGVLARERGADDVDRLVGDRAPALVVDAEELELALQVADVPRTTPPGNSSRS
jgi:hypothetical protein